jgi:hypothetical protein
VIGVLEPAVAQVLRARARVRSVQFTSCI